MTAAKTAEAAVRTPYGRGLGVLLSCWAAGAEAQVSGIEQAIVGGQPLIEQRISPTALIGTCDATLVAPEVLVTAAHCTWDHPTEAWFGPSQREARLTVEISHCVAHPDFETHPDGNDIAYCVLRGDTSAVEAALLVEPDERADPVELVGAELVLIGHGYTSDALGPRVARWVDVQVDDVRHDGRELVVGDSAHGACHGDSGGSAFMAQPDGTTRLVGVVSRRGPSTDDSMAATCASTTIVTSLRPHLEWLKASTAASDGCALGERKGGSPLWLLGLALWLGSAGRKRGRS
jgi:hypothetical protein